MWPGFLADALIWWRLGVWVGVVALAMRWLASKGGYR